GNQCQTRDGGNRSVVEYEVGPPSRPSFGPRTSIRGEAAGGVGTLTIPIRNLYYLLVYAWDCLDLLDPVEVGVQESPQMWDLFAALLAHGTRRVLRRGLSQSYAEVVEESSVVRGRIDVAETIKRLSLPRRKIWVQYEVLSEDDNVNRV